LIFPIEVFKLFDAGLQFASFLLATGQCFLCTCELRFRIGAATRAGRRARMVPGRLAVLTRSRRYQGEVFVALATRRRFRLDRWRRLWRAGTGHNGWFGQGSIAAPRLILIAHGCRCSHRGAGCLEFVVGRNSQNCPALQCIDVVFVKRVRVCLQQGKHHLINIGAFVRSRRARHFGKRFTLRYGTVVPRSRRPSRRRR
jgi:hypothetical protein